MELKGNFLSTFSLTLAQEQKIILAEGLHSFLINIGL